jgi:hypothetical protein
MSNRPLQKDLDQPQSKAEATGSAVKAERHPRTQAATTTTPESVEPRPGPSPAQINAQQKADAERTAPTRAATAPPGTAVVPTPAAPTPASSDAALERNLAEWAGPAGRMMAFNGQTGIHRTLDDNVEVELPARCTAYLTATQRGFIKFNVDAPPTVHMVGIAEEAEPVARETLGDPEGTWPISDFTGKPEDPWKFQYVFPIVSDGAGNELFLYVARGMVATLAVESLLGKWRWHPKRRMGPLPVIEISNGTYFSKKYKSDRPKPLFAIVDWVTAEGEAPAAKAIAAAKHAEFNDQIPF